jgi:hypothetical protein
VSCIGCSKFSTKHQAYLNNRVKAALDIFKNDPNPGVVLEMRYHPVIERYREFQDSNWKLMYRTNDLSRYFATSLVDWVQT